MYHTPVRPVDSIAYNTRSRKNMPPNDDVTGTTGDTAGTTSKYSDEERALMDANMAKRAERLRAESEALRRERENFRAEVAASRNTEIDDTRTAVREMSDLLLSLRTEINNIKRDIETRHDRSPRSPSLPCGQRFSDAPGLLSQHDESRAESPPAPKITYREATEYVPIFDGYNIPLSKFLGACRQARDILPSHYEKSLTRLLVTKLRGHAHSAVADEPCDTVTQLSDLLNSAFGSVKSVAQYRGELTAVYLRPGEHILDYIDRVKELRAAIRDGERRMAGPLAPATVREIDELTASCFCEGLPTPLRLQLKPEHAYDPFEAFAAAKVIAKRDEMERRRYGMPPRRVPDVNKQTSYTNTRQSEADARPGRYLGQPMPPARRRSPPRFDRYRSIERERDFRRDERRSGAARSPPRYERRDAPRQNPNNSSGNWRAQSPPRNERWCRYCKNRGHEIEECRKRQYNNSRLNEPGNGRDPPRRMDAARADPPERMRPINAIETASSAEPESQS